MIRTLSGENDFLLAQEQNRLIHECIEHYGEYALERIDGEEADLQNVVDALGSLPFLTEKKCVVLQQPSKVRGFSDDYASLLDSVSDAVEVLIVEPKLDKRTGYAKYLQKKTEFMAFDALDPAQAPSWLQKEAEARGGQLSRSDAQYFVRRCGSNQFMLHNELDKLVAYSPSITRETIDLLTVPLPQSSLFDLLDAALAGDVRQSLRLYQDQRAQGIEPQQIVAMLARQLQLLAVVMTAPAGTQSSKIAAAAGVHPYAISQIQKLARSIDSAQLPKLITQLRQIDRTQKSQSVDLDEALTYFIVSLETMSKKATTTSSLSQ